MLYNPTILQIGSHTFGLIDVAEFTVGLLFLLLAITLILAWRAQSGRQAERAEQQTRTIEMEMKLAELSGALNQFSNQAQNQQAVLQTALDERLAAVTHRVGQGLADQSQRTSESLSQLHERLAVIDVAQNNLMALSNEMISLKDILSNKQTRGAFGQGRMEAIISDGLHSKAYEFQASLSNGTRPDCIITLPDSRLKLVIDAKFPLEAFNDMKEAVDDISRHEAETRLKSDVMKHVKDISEKYLIGGETHETAIMFVPSESIYVELNERFEDVIQRAHRAHIILASPNVLMLLIQTMQAIVRDAAMREQAGVIQAEVVKLLEDVNRMNERVTKLRTHFAQTAGDLDQLSTSTEKVIRRANKIESLELEEIQAVAPKPRLINSSKP